MCDIHQRTSRFSPKYCYSSVDKFINLDGYSFPMSTYGSFLLIPSVISIWFRLFRKSQLSELSQVGRLWLGTPILLRTGGRGSCAFWLVSDHFIVSTWRKLLIDPANSWFVCVLTNEPVSMVLTINIGYVACFLCSFDTIRMCIESTVGLRLFVPYAATAVGTVPLSSDFWNHSYTKRMATNKCSLWGDSLYAPQ